MWREIAPNSGDCWKGWPASVQWRAIHAAFHGLGAQHKENFHDLAVYLVLCLFGYMFGLVYNISLQTCVPFLGIECSNDYNFLQGIIIIMSPWHNILNYRPFAVARLAIKYTRLRYNQRNKSWYDLWVFADCPGAGLLSFHGMHAKAFWVCTTFKVTAIMNTTKRLIHQCIQCQIMALWWMKMVQIS